MDESTRRDYCPHCGHPTRQHLRLELETQAEVIDSFCRAIIEYIYGARLALARFHAKLDEERERGEQVN